AAIQIKPAN
ncbi:5TMR of 5TMR-LYT family protein, partial [Vibrio parahaemolyticus V-223/04]